MMHPTSTRTRALGVTLFLAVLALLVHDALAGPPLICHEIEIGDAKSLPWGGDSFTHDKKYNATNVVNDTLELLQPDMPVIVRMETLRRAAMYIDRDEALASPLLGALMARALDSEAAGTPHALAWFDAGYLTQCYHQLGAKTAFGPQTKGKRGTEAIAGYAWVVRAIKLRGEDGAMQIAAALMTADTRAPEHEQHLRQALASDFASTASGEDVLQWIAQINGTTLEALRAKYGLATSSADR